MIFTYDCYIDLLEAFRANGYRLIPFREASDPFMPEVIVRHDIDLSPVKALRLAKREHNAGVRATYFVMLTSAFYNPFDKENEYAIKSIMDMGHEIGLHFDISKYQGSGPAALEPSILKELELLTYFVDKPESISWHIPDRQYINKRIPFLNDIGINNAYDPFFFSGYKYISDSNMNWREDPEEHIDTERFQKIQLLTHPIWYNDKATPKSEILEMAYRKKEAEVREYLNRIAP